MRLPKKLRLKILRRHIVKGLSALKRGDVLSGCVVAQALKEKFPRRSIVVGFKFAKVDATIYYLTSSGQHFIHRAVWGKETTPTTLTLTRGDNE